MDDGDIASDYAEEWLEDKLKEHQRNVPKLREYAADEVVEEMICECGEVIPEARVRRGYEICVECARWEEEHTRRTKFRGEI